MANYDKTLDRMHYLMNYDNSLNESTKKTNCGIEYHTTAADGKEYGIIKEGRRFYIKTTTPDKKELAESYDYINGYNYRNENGYNSYNEATKQLELRLMSINESLGKHEDVSVANLNKTKQALDILTEDARKDLDRMHAIFENSFISKDNIGNHGNPEGKGSATGANTTKNNDPFTETAKASLDKDPGFKGTVDKATDDHKEVKGVEEDLQSDKMKKHGDANQNPGERDFKDAHDDLDGEGVADKKPKGAKAVKMNESVLEEPEFNPDDFHADDIDAHADAMDDMSQVQIDKGPIGYGDPLHGLEGLDDDIFGDVSSPEGEVKGQDYWDDYDKAQAEVSDPEKTDDLAGQPEDGEFNTLEEEIDSLLEDFLGEECEGECCKNGCEVLDGPHGGDNGISGNDAKGDGKETMARIEEDADNHEPEGAGEKESKIVGPDGVMDSEEGAGSLPAQSWDKMDEAIERIAQAVCEGLKPKKTVKESTKKKETLEEAIERIVKEEVTKLDAWGKHPRFRKAPMTTPANKEVLAGTAEDDWNDESARGEHPYGLKVGDGKPFDKTVEMLTDQVLANLKESLGLGK